MPDTVGMLQLAHFVQDGTLTIDAPGVLGNDYDDDDYPGPISASLENDVTHGALTLSANGSFVYTPVTGYTGSDSFTYTITDGVESVTAIVDIAVTAENDLPVAIDDAETVAEDGSVVVDVENILPKRRL